MALEPATQRTTRSHRRRAQQAILVAATTALVLLSGAGWAGTGVDADPNAGPNADGPIASTTSTLSLPAPQIGDFGRYNPDDGEPYDWTYAEQGEYYDLEGNHHNTNRIVTTYNWTAPGRNGAEYQSTFHVSQATGEVIAESGRHEDLSIREGMGTTTEEHGWVYSGTRPTNPSEPYDYALGVCGILHPLQGQTVSTTDPIELRSCYPSMITRMIAVGNTLSHVGTWTESGHTYTRYEAAPADSMEVLRNHPYDADTIVALTFRHDLAYPVLMDFANNDDFDRHPDGTLFLSRPARTDTLTGFTAGDGGPLGTATSTQPPLPDIEWGPTPVWGIDDSDFDYPFRLSDAYELALNIPDNPTLRDFMAAHPNAFAAEAWHFEIYDDSSVLRTWYFEMADGDDRLMVCPSQRQTVLPNGDEVPERISVYEPPEMFSCRFDDRLERPTDYSLPNRPTMASVQPVWNAITGALGYDVAMNSVRFYTNVDQDGTPSHEVYYGARHTESSLVTYLAPIGDPEINHLAFEIEFDDEGRIARFSDGYYIVRPRSSAPVEPGPIDRPTEEPGPDAAAFAPASVGAPAILAAISWQAPSPRDATAAGILAALVGMLYWAWPIIKGSTVLAPLFSRIDRPKALTHELRRDIMALVEAEPGIHQSDILKRIDMASGQLRHHLGKLEANGLIGAKRIGRRTCYFPTEHRTGSAPAAPTLDVVMPSERAREIYSLLVERGALAPTEIAADLDVSRQSVHAHLRRLEVQGLVARQGDGRTTSYRASGPD